MLSFTLLRVTELYSGETRRILPQFLACKNEGEKGGIVIVIVIYFTFQRSMIGNKTLGYGTSHNACTSYIHNTTYNCFIKIKLVIKRALVVKYYIEVQR